MIEELKQWMPELLSGMKVTLQLALVSGSVVVMLSTVIALTSLTRWGILRFLSRVYIEVFRSVPMLAMLFLVYYGFGQLLTDLGLSAFFAAVIGIVIVETAYTAEVYRSAILSVRGGQWDAATSLGLSIPRTYWYVILPQAISAAFPPTINMLIYVLQATALASLINVSELTYRAISLMAETFEPMKIFFMITAMYLCITVPLGILGKQIEKRLHNRFGITGRML